MMSWTEPGGADVTREMLEHLEREAIARWKGIVDLVVRIQGMALAQELSPSVEARDNARVLIVSKTSQADALCNALLGQHISATVVSSLGEALTRTRERSPHLVALDESQIEDCVDWEQLRGNGLTMIAVISNSSAEEAWRRWMHTDIDLSLSRSMSVVEQVARLKAVLRRCQPGKDKSR